MDRVRQTLSWLTTAYMLGSPCNFGISDTLREGSGQPEGPTCNTIAVVGTTANISHNSTTLQATAYSLPSIYLAGIVEQRSG